MSTRRPYNSSVRDERAAETRLRIREAARHLFSANGFVETTIAEIAASAGVATQTVYAVYRTKGAIVASILDSIEEAADIDSHAAGIFGANDAHVQLTLFVSWIRTLFEDSAPVLRAAFKALGDPHVAAFASSGDTRRRQGCIELTTMWSKRDALREGLDPSEAAQVLWLLTGPEQYLAAVDRLGWTPDDYEQWLSSLLKQELLATP